MKLVLTLLLALPLLADLGQVVQGQIYVPESTGNVQVTMYSESLCPYCSRFIVNRLHGFFVNGLIEIVDLRIVPYGNAHVGPNGTIICQHGPGECKLNVIQSCAIKLWPNVRQWFPFIYCLESLPQSTAAATWTNCIEPSGLGLDPIKKCYEGPLGGKIVREFKSETESLQPPHKYVPWVLVNGQPLYEDYYSVEKYVCKAYKGPKALPNVCKDNTSLTKL